jgi:hypothetical protein
MESVMSERQPTHHELAIVLNDLKAELAELRAEMQPVIKAYEAATMTARVLKWVVGLLASVAAIYAAWFTVSGR